MYRLKNVCLRCLASEWFTKKSLLTYILIRHTIIKLAEYTYKTFLTHVLKLKYTWLEITLWKHVNVVWVMLSKRLFKLKYIYDLLKINFTFCS